MFVLSAIFAVGRFRVVENMLLKGFVDIKQINYE